MVAHSFSGTTFGPAQRLHGATFVVDAQLRRSELDSDGVVVDIGRAAAALNAVLAEFNFQNLDDNAEFSGQNTTTEFMARIIFDRLAQRIAAGELGAEAAGLASMRICLHESHVAWAAYEGPLDR